MNTKSISRLLSPLVLLLIPATALAHPGHHHDHLGVWAGILHPITGVDHLLAALAVGALAFLLGGRSRYQLPSAFVASMLLGALMVAAGLAVPGVHMMAALTVISLGVLIGLARQCPRWAVLFAVSAFGLIHGGAHLAGAAQVGFHPAGFVAALLLSTALLHLGGYLLAVRFIDKMSTQVPRFAAAGLAMAGMLILSAELFYL